MRIASTGYFRRQLLAAGITCGLLATYAYAIRPATEDAAIPMIAQESAVERLLEVPVATTAKLPAPPPAPSNQLLFVFQVGKDTYVKLSADTPKHGKRRFVDDEGATTTVAEVDAKNLPRALRGWDTKEVILDGGCTAKVTGFAVVTRLIGDPGYAGLDDEKWTLSTAASQGASMFAARVQMTPGLECKDALYARDASLAPIIAMEKLEDAKLAATAKSALLAGETAKAAQTAWDEYAGRDTPADFDGTSLGTAWYEHVTFDTRVMRHPTTGTTWIAIHATATEQGCGGPQINAFGLYKLNQRGQLVTVEDRMLEDVWLIDRIVDVDNDGKLELVGKDWLGMRNIHAKQDGTEVSRLEMPFYGCPC